MSVTRCPFTAAGLGLILSAIAPDCIEGQDHSDQVVGNDTVVVAHKGYEAGRLRRLLFGDNYRDLWTTPIRVPLLDLRTYRGGLRGFKTGGGKATRTLRLLGPDSSQFVFRPVYKSILDLPSEFRHTIIWDLMLDARSATHPAAPLAVSPPLEAVRTLHPTPRLFVMPDDTLLGEFRKEFAGVLGTLEEFPDVPEKGMPFAGATRIINDDDLLQRINKDPHQQIDSRAFLTAHLVDMLVGDADRHSGQWKWARLQPGADWLPIPRDRDLAFVSHEGLVPRILRLASPSLVRFDARYAPVSARFHSAIEFDRRLLAGLEKPVWDSIAGYVAQVVTDSVLDAAVHAMPPEYARSSAMILAKLRTRRDGLAQAASDYYRYLARLVDLHATDSADRATIVRSGDGFVDVAIQLGNKPPWFKRRFASGETQEIRLYLHDGDDTAVVTGNAARSIPLRIIGGNGNNTLVDSSMVGGRRGTAYLYDEGRVTGVMYESDSVIKLKSERSADDLPYNRLPWLRVYGKTRPPERDRGSAMTPVFGLSSGHGLGLVPRVGVAQYRYGFRMVPYASMVRAEVAYSTTNRFETVLTMDKRFEGGGLHVAMIAGMSQLGMVEFRGFGNDVPNLRGSFYDVRQRQWSLRPAIALSFGPKSDVSLGPVVRYTMTDSAANRFISQERPYGFDRFGQVGLRLEMHHDTRSQPDTARLRGGFSLSSSPYPPLWGTIDLAGSVYPSVWDTRSSYQQVSARASAHLTVPVLTRPVVALRAGGEKLFGNFPFFDAAFLGGSRSLRTEHRQRFAGDALIHGTTELRVPVARFPFVLPLDVGAIGFVDVGRIYLHGDSPGGWHTGTGAGFWIGVIRPETGINVTITNNPDRRVLTNLGFVF